VIPRRSLTLIQRQRGAAAIIVGLSLALFLSMVGLAVDTARMYVTRTELQSAMDSCALAAAAQLSPGTVDATNFALNAAVAHGLSLSNPALSSGGGGRPDVSVNKAVFQSRNLVQSSIVVAFSNTLNGTYSTVSGGATTATSKFVRCSYSLTDLPLTFMLLLNLVPNAGASVSNVVAISASAVASRSPSSTGNPTGSTTCGVTPIAVCRASASATFGLVANQWVNAPCASGAGSCPPVGPGNFGWIDFSPPAGGASELAAGLSSQGQCGSLAIGTEVGQTGVAASVQDAWNSRFGLYKNGSGYDITNAPPDYTGFSYNTNSPVSGGAYRTSYLTARSGAQVFNSASAGFGSNNFNATTSLNSSQYAQYGRNRRLIVAPIVDCSEFSGGSGLADIKGFACMFMLAPYPTSGPTGSFVQKVEFVGLLSDPNTPCSLSGVPGSGGTGTGGVAASVPFLVQ
jgi:Flp pilus assembly protein TadG